MSNIVLVVIGIGVGILGLALGWLAHKLFTQARIGDAEQLANKIVQEAHKEAETTKKAAMLEAKDEWYKAKINFEKETKAKQQELQQIERRHNEKSVKLDRREEQLNRKSDELENRDKKLNKHEQQLNEQEKKIEELVAEQNSRLEEIASLTKEEAKQILMGNMEKEARLAAAVKVKEIIAQSKREGEKKAQEIITLAIQRCAADQVVESTVSVVALPNEEMKGRIIGREGRNIRAFESITGIDVIIDDTPEAVILSGFDPIRREVARLSLEKLILDGRIHPARIEEVVEKTVKEFEATMHNLGEQASFDANVHGIQDDLITLLGRLAYRTSYGQNVLQHSKEVAWLCGIMASELGMNAAVARRAGLLHDIGKAVDHEVEGTHAEIGALLAKKHNESKLICNAIHAHHEDVEPESLIAVLVQAADAISGARPGARRETLETYIKRLEKLEEIAVSFQGVSKSYAIQAGREVRVIVESGVLDDAQTTLLTQEIVKKIETELEYPGQIRVTVIREFREIAYAK